MTEIPVHPDPLVAIALDSLEADKAEAVVVVPLTGKASFADHMIIASGRSGRQVAAMAEHLASRFREVVRAPVRVEGLPRADWVLIDTGDLVVHLFRPEVRAFYNLEKMWGATPPPPPPTIADPLDP